MPSITTIRHPKASRLAASARVVLSALFVAAFLPNTTRIATADEPAPTASLAERAAAALDRGLPLVTKAATNYPEHRKCFSCHHQTLPMMAIVAARDAGRAADQATLRSQAEFTHASFAKQLDDLRAGENIGGRGLTVGYGLWALSLADWPADEITAAMTTYLVKTQKDDGHWPVHTGRPPMEESSESTTAIAAAGLRKYAPAEASEEKQQIDAAIAKARAWLLAATPKSTEDKTSRLSGLHLLGATSEELQSARDVVLAAQRDDGGWPQLDDMPSDAYATGQTLCVLIATGMAPTAPECQRGIEFLLRTQHDDGSWFVKTRSTPVQVIFDNGDPHGTDQFISTPATCWALTALAMSAKK